MTSPFAPWRSRGLPVLLDGGLATELERRGHDLRDPLWSARLLLEAPDALAQVHYDYYRAGADVATSASYQASFAGLAARGLDGAAAGRVLTRSVAVADDARRRYLDEHRGRTLPLLVAASVGPYGAALADGAEYRGDYGLSAAQLRAFHMPRLEVLAAAGADILACETIPSGMEVEVLAGLLAQFDAMPAWISVTCGDDARLRDGTPIEAALAAAEAVPHLAAFGINCTAPQHVTPLLARLRPLARVPLLVYPNSGEGWDPDAKAWTPAPPEAAIVALAPAWYAGGAVIIGGCCRTTPETIADLAAALRPGSASTRETPKTHNETSFT